MAVGLSCYVYISPFGDNLMELALVIDAAKRASAAQIIAVVPYFGCGSFRDRKDKPRVSICSQACGRSLSVAGIDRLITMDLHADRFRGFFDVPVDHLYASSIFILAPIESLRLENMVIASPDVGGAREPIP